MFDTGKEFLEEFREAAGRTPLQMLRASKKGQSTEKTAATTTVETPFRQPKKAGKTMPTLAERTPSTRAANPVDDWKSRLRQ